ncbi:MAG: tRNA lysidine(34) synthetase TilS [Deltaproteobacteria bacterium]|nr:tRNA lysidine(34) synthetase TilS [Deltaproteobacteria bacterium]
MDDTSQTRVLSALRGPATRLIPPGSRLLIACSGGADSVALAHAAVRAGHWEVALGHVDHGLRPESVREAGLVQALGDALRVRVFVTRLDRGEIERAIEEEGLEAAARRLRYRALLEQATEHRASHLATAHTQRDQAETVLLRLARGGGLGALVGVRETRRLEGVTLVRPLLQVSRSDTEAHCAQEKLAFVQDPHNIDPARPRARVRQAFGVLNELLGPRLEEALGRSARIAFEEDELLHALARSALAQAQTDDTSGLAGLSIDALSRLPVALLRRVIVLSATASGLKPEQVHVDTVCALVLAGQGSCDVPSGHALARAGRLEFRAGPRVDTDEPEVAIAVPGPGRYTLGDAELSVDVPVIRGNLVISLNVDPAQAPLPWTLRNRRPGDRFRPAGGREKKLSDLWIDAKIARESRGSLAVLQDSSGGIFYAEGLRPGRAARATSGGVGLTLSRGVAGCGGQRPENTRADE